MSSNQNVVESHSTKTANKTVENVAELQCFGMTIMDKN
jgi:hypothetical protein